ncbi:hypothetical protein JB92DRAFT_3039025 [Gautieria morchelliformis]|nr:hypothetical protein JB92DRAFT_3039025 [Gautieria morchelliformis]
MVNLIYLCHKFVSGNRQEKVSPSHARAMGGSSRGHSLKRVSGRDGGGGFVTIARDDRIKSFLSTKHNQLSPGEHKLKKISNRS